MLYKTLKIREEISMTCILSHLYRMMTWPWNVNRATKGPTSNPHHDSRLFCFGSYWDFLKSFIKFISGIRGSTLWERRTSSLLLYARVYMQQPTCGWGRVRTLYADVLRGACLTPTNLCGVSAVVSPYLLLPLVSRLVTWRTAEWNTATHVSRRWRTDESFHSVWGIRKAEFHENPKFASKADAILLSVCRPWLLNLHILPVYPFLSSPLCSISVIAPSVVKPSEIVAGEVRLPSTRVTIIFSSVCVSDRASEHGSISHIIQLCSLRAVYMGQ